MTGVGRGVVGIGGALSAVLLGLDIPAYAEGVHQLPNDPGAPSDGIPGAFVFLFVVGILVSIGFAVWKVSTAQKLARGSGMDPSLATQMALLTDDGLDATYLAANLRQPPLTSTQPGPAGTQDHAASTAERLTELKSLLDQGLISSSEYDARRAAIIDTV